MQCLQNLSAAGHFWEKHRGGTESLNLRNRWRSPTLIYGGIMKNPQPRPGWAARQGVSTLTGYLTTTSFVVAAWIRVPSRDFVVR